MKVIKEGKAHKKMAWYYTCPNCDSKLRIIDGDPSVSRVFYNCDRRQYWIRLYCPICNAKLMPHTASAFGEKANAEYESIILTEEDREEIKNFENVKHDDKDPWLNDGYPMP